MKHDDLNVVCDNYEQWKAVLRNVASAATFEIHCWNEKTEWIELALQYGSKKEFDRDYGTVISGAVNSEFIKLILELAKPKDVDIYNKMTSFFSIFLNNGFSPEHYGTEIPKV